MEEKDERKSGQKKDLINKMKAVIFDRDGVILDSESCNIHSAVKSFQKLGIVITEEEKEWIAGRHHQDYLPRLLEKYDFSYPEFRKIQHQIYHELLESAPLFEKTISFIKKLHALNIPLALTTSSDRKSTLHILDKTGLNKVFEVIVTFEDYEKRKPHPESYLLTARKLNISPEECIVIEDSSVGVEAAKRAGMKCIALPNEYTQKQDFHYADLVVDSADAITVEVLNNL